MGYQEEVELNDTYNVQVCKGLSGEITTLAQTRLDGGINNLRSRILPETLAAFPVLAATGTKDAEYARNLGEGSPYRLPRGLNAS